MKRHRMLMVCVGIVITCFIFTVIFLYSKNVQTAKLINDLQVSLKSSNYTDAKMSYDKASKDIFINKLFGFNEKASNLMIQQYAALKSSYLVDSMSYSEFNSKVAEIKKLDSFNEDEAERVNIDRIEDIRVVYRSVEASMSKKDYKASLDNLNKIDASIDEVYKNKLNNLKAQISNLVLQDTDAKLNDYLSKGTFESAIKFLEGKKGILSNEYIVENTNKINAMIEKRKEEEELKRKKAAEAQKRAAEEAKKREAAFIASYLKNYVPNPEKEKAVSTFSSRTHFLIWVNLTSQETNIFVRDKGNWKLIHSYPSATGKAGDETPTGTFTIKERGKWFYSDQNQEGAKYWVRFTGEYLFHSLPMNQAKQVLDSTLGTPASHGCVRLAVDNAAWLYSNVPVGTTVYINY